MKPLSRKLPGTSPTNTTLDSGPKRARPDDSSISSSSSKITSNKTAGAFLGKASERGCPQTKKSRTNLDLPLTHTLEDSTAKCDIRSDNEPRLSDAREVYLEELKRIDEKIERDRAARRAQIMSGAPFPQESETEIPQPPDLTEVLANYLKSLPPPNPSAVVIPPALTRFPPLESFLPPDSDKK